MKCTALWTVVLLICGPVGAAQQTDATAPARPITASPALEGAQTVVVESTITGNQEQPKTIYVLPWQDSVARIKMPATGQIQPDRVVKPLDREQFLRFIQAQPLLTSGQAAAQVPEQAPVQAPPVDPAGGQQPSQSSRNQ